MDNLLQKIRQCKVCEAYLKEGVNPIVAASPASKLIIIGQAPGRIVHHSGIPWNDKSGDNLRAWLGIDTSIFYDTHQVAIVPMGFCYPGTGKSGDLAPRPECAPLWHQPLLAEMPQQKLTLLIGQYAQKYYLQNAIKQTLTETVRHFREYLPKYFVLPHPSPRNNIWQANNEWFKAEVLPTLKKEVQNALNS